MFIPIRRIFIILGNACNLRCSYCLQASKHIEYVKPEINVLVMTEVANLLAGSGDNFTVGGRDPYEENPSGAKPYDDSDYFNW